MLIQIRANPEYFAGTATNAGLRPDFFPQLLFRPNTLAASASWEKHISQMNFSGCTISCGLSTVILESVTTDDNGLAAGTFLARTERKQLLELPRRP